MEVLAGVGNAALAVPWWPMLMLLIPRDRAGVFAGLSAMVQSLALPASVVLAGWLIERFATYRVTFVLLALTSVVTLLSILSVRLPTRGYNDTSATGEPRR